MNRKLLEEFLEKNKSKKIVFTNGCFDILHSGHVTYLNEAKSLGDILIVGLNSDESVKRLKGSDRPIYNEQDRKFILENLKAVDWVELFSEDTPLNLIQRVCPQILVKGGDYDPEKIVGSSFVKEKGGQVKCLTFLVGHSSSSVISMIKKTH